MTNVYKYAVHVDIFISRKFIFNFVMSVVIGVEGYTLPSGFVMKELCMLFPNGEYNHFLFAKPDMELTEGDLRAMRYTTENLNNLSYDDGDTPYNLIGEILEKVKDCRISTYSEISLKTLQKFLPTTLIVNVQNRGFKMPAVLPKYDCFRNHNSRYCAKSKAFEVMKYLC